MELDRSGHEHNYLVALIALANAEDAELLATARELLKAFDELSTRRVGRSEALLAQRDARLGLLVVMRWGLRSQRQSLRWLKRIDRRLPKRLPATVSYTVLQDQIPWDHGRRRHKGFERRIPAPGGVYMDASTTEIGISVPLRSAVALALALFAGDRRWRGLLLRCRLPSCRRLYIATGEGRPGVACCAEHKDELHRAQMRVGKARKVKPRDKALKAEQEAIDFAEDNARNPSSPKLWS